MALSLVHELIHKLIANLEEERSVNVPSIFLKEVEE